MSQPIEMSNVVAMRALLGRPMLTNFFFFRYFQTVYFFQQFIFTLRVVPYQRTNFTILICQEIPRTSFQLFMGDLYINITATVPNVFNRFLRSRAHSKAREERVISHLSVKFQYNR